MSPAATLARVAPIAAEFGVTRLADVSGLDVTGIPVFQAIRPLSRSISVSQGKGATRVAARVSALMEAIELHCAEAIAPTCFGPASPDEEAFCVGIAPRAPTRPFRAGAKRGWCKGADLLTGRALRIPHRLVSMDLTRPPDPWFEASSNGLASGNDRTEAIIAALCEVIERDALVRWLDSGMRARRRMLVDAATVAAPLPRRLMRRLSAAGMGFRIWEIGQEHGVPVMVCALYELAPHAAMRLPPVIGTGAHPDHVVALVRAITEAAQARTTLIAGSRDDLGSRPYTAAGDQRMRLLLEIVGGDRGGRDWDDLRGWREPTLEGIQHGLVARCAATGAPVIGVLDLTPEDLPIAVVKIVIPGFGDHGRTPAARRAATEVAG